MLKSTLPKLARLALQLPICLKQVQYPPRPNIPIPTDVGHFQPIPLVRKGMNHTISLTQQQAACLLANALFCTFPPRSRLTSDAKNNTFMDINFSRLFTLTETGAAKLNCLFHYFSRVLTKSMVHIKNRQLLCLI